METIELLSNKTDTCFIWLYYADYIPGGSWKISDSTVMAIFNDVEDSAISDLLIRNYLQNNYYYDVNWSVLPGLFQQSRYKRYHGPGRNDITKNIPFYAELTWSHLWLMGFNMPNCIITPGIKYSSPNPRYENYIISHPNSYIMFQSVDSGYDRYLRETYAIALGLNSSASNDLTSLWDYKEVYSNITNGIGIFGCTFKLKLYLKDCIYFEDPGWKRYDFKFPDYE